MIDIVTFRAEHLAQLRILGSGESGAFKLTPPQLQLLEAQNSWTVLVDSYPIACGGMIEHWPGRYQGWAYIGKQAGPHMTAITKAAQQVMAAVSGRIEMTVRKDFEPGQHWARLLGFSIETPLMPKFGPEGEDHIGYVKFQD